VIAEAYIGDLQVHGDDTIALTGFTIGSPDPRAVVDVRPEDHGTVDGTRWYGSRVFGLSGRIVGADQAAMWAALDDLKGALALGQVVILRFRRSGLSFLERATVRVAGAVDVPLDAGLAASPMLRFGVSLEAPDPRIYSDTASSGAYDPTDAGTGGLIFPLTFPLEFDASAGAGTLQVENEGTIGTPVVLTITGPVTNPILDNDTAGLSIYTRDLELSAGDTLELDTLTRTVLLGTTPRPDLVDVSLTDWWTLLPGVNQLRLRGSGMSAGSTELAVSYRSARI
jgi:hypothetical protein